MNKECYKKNILNYKNYTMHMSKGFSLIESLVAISVLLLALIGPFTIATRGLTSANFARDQVTAFYLAQEATEIIRSKRDNNALAGEAWDKDIDKCFDKECIVDATKNIDSSNAIKVCGASCDVLQQSPSSKLYGYKGNWDNTKFTRIISIKGVNSDEIRATVTISWTSGSINKSFSITETFFDWQ